MILYNNTVLMYEADLGFVLHEVIAGNISAAT